MGDIAVLLKEIEEARPHYEKADRYSRGKVSEVWANKRLERVMRRSADKYRVNIARRPIDAVLDRLEIISVAAESATEGADPADDPMTKVLNQVIWDGNELDLKIPDALDWAETFGDAYLICWPRPEDEQGVDVIPNNPKSVRVIYDPERPDRILFSGRTWLDSDGYRRVTLWRDGPVRERYRSKEVETAYPVDGYKDTDFLPFQDDEDDPESWREDLQLGLGNPVFHLRTADVDGYGVPEHESVYGTQNMLTKLIATMMDATDGYGFPFRYQLVKAGTTGTLADLDDEWEEGDSDGPTPPRQSRAEPGTIAKLYDTEEVGQLQPADVANLLDPLGMTLRLSSVVSNTPLNYFDPSAAAASGESKKEHEKPAVNKADNRLRRFNATLRKCLSYAMALNGTVVPGVVINWAPTETVDDLAEVQLASARRDVGVPLKEVLVRLGFPERDVQSWIDEATPDDEVLEHRVALLKELAQAAQALGAAASLGVIDEETARLLITRMITSGAQPGELPPIPEPGDGGDDDGPGRVPDPGEGTGTGVPAGVGA